jgi:hypothetical protein
MSDPKLFAADAGDPPGAAAPPPPPPPTPGEAPLPPSERRGSGGMRALAVIGCIVLAFAAAVMIVAMVDIGRTPTCDDVRAGNALPYQGNCFDGSSTQKTISLVLGWPSGVLGGLAALLALAFAITARRGRLALQVTAAAVVLAGLSLLIGSL